jgi:ferredoxin
MAYQESIFYFYSGTGNSCRVATWMTSAARAAGTPSAVCPIASADPRREVGRGKTFLLGLVMPTHGFTAPWAMIRFALRLPRRRNTHAVVVATRAGTRFGSLYLPGFEGTATLFIALILALKGYRIRGAAGIDMPSNWIAVHPGFAPDAAAGIVARARVRVAGFMDAVLSGKWGFDGWIVALFGVLVLPISLAYLLIGRLFLAKLFFASNRCTGCGLCAAHCPNGAIMMRGGESRRRPYWTFRCESCMRCMAFCPTQAVEASHLLGVGVYLLAGAIPTSTFLVWLAARVPVLALLGKTPRWVLESVNAVLALGLAYPILHVLLRIGWINRFFTLATFTHYYRRYHEPETTLRDLGRGPSGGDGPQGAE